MEKLSVEIGDLATRFDALLAQAESGHEIIVTASGQPRAVLTPLPVPAPLVEPIG